MRTHDWTTSQTILYWYGNKSKRQFVQIGSKTHSRHQTKNRFLQEVKQATSVPSAFTKEEARVNGCHAETEASVKVNEEQPICQMKEEFNLQSEMAVLDAKVKV